MGGPTFSFPLTDTETRVLIVMSLDPDIKVIISGIVKLLYQGQHI